MTTMATIESGHFDGHKNLTSGQQKGTEEILENFLTQAKADLSNLGQGPTLTPGAEAADVIAVTFQSPVAAVQQYIAEAMVDTTMEVDTAAFTIAETGGGAEVSPTARGRLIFTTSATGAATLSVTDVVGASGATVYLLVKPLLSSAASEEIVAPAEVSITFD